MKILSWVWALVPLPAKPWILLAAIACAGFLLYKLEERGYNRCKAEYASAELEHKEKARGEIVESGKVYEKIKTVIIHQAGPDDAVGPRVSAAIDSMP